MVIIAVRLLLYVYIQRHTSKELFLLSNHSSGKLTTANYFHAVLYTSYKSQKISIKNHLSKYCSFFFFFFMEYLTALSRRNILR